MAKLYNSFRVNISKRIGGNPGFIAIGEMRLFVEKNGSVQQLLSGGTATASNTFDQSGNYQASNAFDGNPETRWATSSVSSAWLRYDLTAPAPKPEYIYLSLSTSPENAPSDFILQASVDGGFTWEDIYTVNNFATPSEIAQGVSRNLFSLGLVGKVVIDNSHIFVTSRVMVYDWVTGELLKKLTPDSAGNWRYIDASGNISHTCLVVVTSTDGESNIRPQAHGPVDIRRLE